MSLATRGLLATSFLTVIVLGPWLGVGVAEAQVADQTELVGHMLTRSAGNDVWGYSAPDGTEIAIMGTTTGTSFVDVTQPDRPFELAFFPGPGSVWRDIKTYGAFAYIVNETSGGLQIVSMENPREPVLVEPRTATFERCHNIYIDEAAAMLYAVGAPSNTMYVLDVSRPNAPSLKGSFRDFYIHDIYVRDGIGYAAAINRGDLATLDVSDPSDIRVLDTIQTPGNFTHNTWLSDDGRHCFTTDENGGGHLGIYNVEDPENIVYVGEFHHPSDRTAIVHNVTVHGDFAYVSWYTNGLQVVDVSDPANPVHAGFFDTYPGVGGGFQGAWGVYPFARSGLTYISDINSGLFIVDFTGQNAQVVATVIDGTSGQPVAGAQIHAGRGPVTTDASGRAELDLHPGPREIMVSAFAYESWVEIVDLAAREERELTVTLTREPTGAVRGVLTDLDTHRPLADVTVEIGGTPLVSVTTDEGAFEFTRVPAGEYVLRTAVDGYQAVAFAVDVRVDGQLDLELPALPSRFYDDAEEDRGWLLSTPEDDAISGQWERADPALVVAGPAQPTTDHSVRGSLAFITGAARPGDLESDHDVDGGRTTLRSPAFDIGGMVHPTLECALWFSNDLGSNPGKDAFLIDASNDGGATWVNLATVAESTDGWETRSFDLAAVFATPGDRVQVRFVAQDVAGGSLVEAAIDDVSLFEQRSVLSGHVLDLQTREPIDGARVEVLDPQVPLSGFEMTTDATGAFRSILLPGRHTVEVSAFGYEPASQTFDLAGGRDVSVELARRARGTIEGRLERAGSSRPVGGVTVILENTPLRTTSDAAGAFAFADVPEGSYRLRTEDDAYGADAVTVDVEAGETTDLRLTVQALLVTRLESSYPNPFLGETSLRFQLADPQRVAIRIVDGQGRLVRRVEDAAFEAGTHEVRWDGRDEDGRAVPAGLYFQIFESSDRTDTGKVLRLR